MGERERDKILFSLKVIHLYLMFVGCESLKLKAKALLNPIPILQGNPNQVLCAKSIEHMEIHFSVSTFLKFLLLFVYHRIPIV